MNSIHATVLVIEAHPMMREALCSAIGDEPELKVVMQAGNISQALQMMTFLPDMILFGLTYPDNGDMEELANLHKSLPRTPILALTSNEVDGQEQAALAAGAQMVLTKAAPRTELIYSLRELWTKAIMNYSEVNNAWEVDGKIS